MHQYNILNNIPLNYLPEDDVKIAIDSIQHKIISSDIILISIQLYALSVDLPKSKKFHWAFYTNIFLVLFFYKLIFIMSVKF